METAKIKVRLEPIYFDGSFYNDGDSQERPYGLLYEVLYQDPTHRIQTTFTSSDGFIINSRYYPVLVEYKNDIIYINSFSKSNKELLDSSNYKSCKFFQTLEEREQFIKRVQLALKEWVL